MCKHLSQFCSFSSQASLADEDDCVKFFVCELGSRLDTTLTDFEAYVNDQFASNLGEMDLASGAVEFDLASVVGRWVGEGLLLYGPDKSFLRGGSKMSSQKFKTKKIWGFFSFFFRQISKF